MPRAKLCADCGAAFIPPGPRVRRCPSCQVGWSQQDNARRNAKPSKSFYQTAAWRRVAAAVRARDGSCTVMIDGQRCGSTWRLMAHHVRPRAEIEAEGGDVFDMANLRTVCARCSGKLDGGRGAAGRRNGEESSGRPRSW